MVNKKKINKSAILFNRMNFMLITTSMDLDMTVGEVNKSIMMLLDENLDID